MLLTAMKMAVDEVPETRSRLFQDLKINKEDNMKIPAVVAEMKPVTKSTVYRKIKLLEKAKLLERTENESCDKPITERQKTFAKQYVRQAG